MYYESEKAKVYNGDCLELLATIPRGSVDAIVSDPPYAEVNRPYGKLTEKQWHKLMRGVVAESRRVLKPTGSAVFILQPNSEKVGRMRPWLFEFMAQQAKEWNLVQDAWWWNMTTLPSAGATNGGLLRGSLKACVWLGPPTCYRDQMAILWTESESNAAKRLNARCVREKFPSGHSVNRAACAGAALRRGGVTPFNVFPISNGDSASSGGAFGHGAATPFALCDKWVRYICPTGGTVLDMFNGSGTVGIAAVKSGRRYIGIEKETQYCEMSRQRISEVDQGEVSFDDLDGSGTTRMVSA